MKTMFTILLLCASLAMKAQQLTSLEYFFDTDPGFGNGTQVALSNTPSLDSTFNFSVNGLPQGIHTIFIRLKNSNNDWSCPIYQGNFLLWTGTAGSAQIQMLNYFIDSTTNINSIPLNLTSSLDTTLSILIPDNGADARILGLRLKNQSGQFGNAVLNSVSLCDLYKPDGGFRIGRYANTYTLFDTSRYNSSGKLHWLVDNVLYDSAYMTNYTFPANFIGTKNITQLSGTGCRVDTVTRLIAMEGVEDYEPRTGAYGSDFEMSIYGGGMDTSMNIYLQKGDTIVHPYLKLVYEGKKLIALFDFHGFHKDIIGTQSFTDNYQLHVIFPNSYHYVGPAGVSFIRIEALNGCNGAGLPEIHCPPKILVDGDLEPYFTTELTGNQYIRTGFWNTLTLNVTNTGTVVARNIPVYLLLPAHFNVDTSQWIILTSNPGLHDSVSIVVPIDTVIAGQHYQLKLYALVVPILGPGETKSLPLRVLTTVGGTSPFLVWADHRMFGSPFKAFWPPCVESVFNLVIGFVPVIGCVNSVWDWATSSTLALTGFDCHAPTALSLTLNTASAIVSCVPGATAAVDVASLSITKELAAVGANGSKMSIYIADKSIGHTGFVNDLVGSACDPKTQKQWSKKDIFGRAGYDPNQLTGNNQYDSVRHFINNYSTQKYFVSFENLPTATANAQHVYVTDTLHAADFVFKSFALKGFNIGDSSYLMDSYRTTVTRDVKLKNRQDMKVRFVASFDTAAGILRSDFFSIDTSGHVLNPNSLDGFLPPDIDGVTGTGSVQFEIAAKNRNTLDTFRNKATIYFDNNPPIPTNSWLNTIDTTAPVGHIANAIRVNDTTFKLIIQQSDIGSGNQYNTFYAKKGSDSLFRNYGIAFGDTILFTGQLNQTYQMFSKATDNVGNEQNKDSVADITIVFSNPLPLTWLSFTGKLITDKVQLQWTTTNELNTSYFEVQKSIDGNFYNKIAVVAAKGSSTHDNDYLTWDDHPAYGNNYYRLKQFDIDGHFTYSSIVRIYYGKNGYVIIAPNPASNYVSIRGNQQFTAIQLIDAAGKTVKIFQPSVNNIYSLFGVSKGLYYLRLINIDETQTYKLQIE